MVPQVKSQPNHFFAKTPVHPFNSTKLIVCLLVPLPCVIFRQTLDEDPHARLKRKKLNRRYILLNLRLLDNLSQLSLTNKLLIYTTII